MRLLLDRRQELVRAKAYGRVIVDELRLIESLLDYALESGEPVVATAGLPTEAWDRYRADIAAVLLDAEFMALSTTYRGVASFNHAADTFRPQVEADVARGQEPPPLPDRYFAEIPMILLPVRQLAIPSVEWLARGDLPVWRRRSAMAVLTPFPDARCSCGHAWDVHRWEWRKLGLLRVRRRDHKGMSVAHECNIVGCGCGRFNDVTAPRLTWLFRRFNLAPQAAWISEVDDRPALDTSIPSSAQPGAKVDPETFEVLNEAELWGERAAEDDAS